MVQRMWRKSRFYSLLLILALPQGWPQYRTAPSTVVTKTPRGTLFFLLEDLERGALTEKISVWGILERRELEEGILLTVYEAVYVPGSSLNCTCAGEPQSNLAKTEN